MFRFHPALPTPGGLAFARRHFLFQMGAAALAVHPLLGCGGGGDVQAFPTPQPGDTFVARDFTLSQTQSPAQLANWLETLHPEHHINGWYFMGSLGGEGAEFTLSVERIAGNAGGQPMRVGATYMDRSLDTWKIAGVDTQALPLEIASTADPWNFTMRVPMPGAPPLLSMKTLSGRFGSVGAEYLLQMILPEFSGSILAAEVRLRDPFGVIGEGYGTAAFTPGNITPTQRSGIVYGHGGSMQAWLDATGDPMIDQGNFYYQLPLMEVVSYSVALGEQELARGEGGLWWCDYVAATYSAASIAAYKQMVSNFFAIQLPQSNTAIMVLRIDSLNGSMPTAMLFDDSSPRGRNGARSYAHAWPITGIDVAPDPASRWVSPVTGNVYHLRYRIRLDSPERHADFTVTMATANQEVPLEGEPTYAGLATVAGTLDGRPVSGQCFVEFWAGLKQ